MAKAKTEPQGVQPPDAIKELAHWRERAEKAEAKLAALAAVEPVAGIQGGTLHFTEWIKHNHPKDMLLYPAVAVPAKE